MKLFEFEGYIQSIYLAEYEHGLLLLDGCCRADVEDICRFITAHLKRPVTDLKLVISTHMHPDHAGAAEKLRSITGCQIATGQTQYSWYRGLDGFLMYLTDMALTKWVANRKGKKAKLLWYNRHLKADIQLSNNQRLPNFEDWQVITTHGHTDRDISLYHAQTNKIYVADLIVKVKGRYVPPFPVFYPSRYKTSLNTIEQLNADKIILAHGGEVELTTQDFDYLKQKAPIEPSTHWRSVKKKFKQVFLS